jgi:Ni/Fe-hydrogenase subunit HybB-like protein
MNAPEVPKITFWRAVFAVLMLAGAYATYLRVRYGLGGVTNLNDQFPWGIWIGFDILCGVGLAAGGFTLVAIVHIFNIERYQPILRPAILTAFLGYVLVVVALLFDLGRPDRVWHPLVLWNPHSVMFEVAWCVTLYSTVLALEFIPVIFERLQWKTALGWMHAISVPLMIAGVILSTLHQSSLGTLYLIVPSKLYALWYTPLLPVFFYVSAIAVGLAMTIFESWHSSRAFGRQLELPLLASMGRVLAVALMVLTLMRFLDLKHRGVLGLLLQNRSETYLYLLEVALTAAPMLLLFQARVQRSAGALYACAVMTIFGFIANRLNVSITGMEAGSGTHYVPRWTEIAVTLSIIAAGFATFRLIAGQLPIFAAEPVDGRQALRSRTSASEEAELVRTG